MPRGKSLTTQLTLFEVFNENIQDTNPSSPNYFMGLMQKYILFIFLNPKKTYNYGDLEFSIIDKF